MGMTTQKRLSDGVLASRLTEDPEISVLLLETEGNDDLAAIPIPAEVPTCLDLPLIGKYDTIRTVY